MALTLLHGPCTFDAADQVLNGFSEAGATFANFNGGGAKRFAIVSNQASNDGNCILIDDAMSAVDIQASEATISGSDAGLVTRWANGSGSTLGDLYLAYTNGNLYKLTAAGGFTLVGSTGASYSAGQVWNLRSEGDTHTLAVNGTDQTPLTDSDFATGKCGFYGGSGASALFDDFSDYVDAPSGTLLVNPGMTGNMRDLVGGIRG